MPKIKKWSKKGLGRTWRHDEKQVSVTIEGPTIGLRDSYRVVKRSGGGMTVVEKNIDTKKQAEQVAIQFMRNNPDPMTF